jgi:hypothetical protein
MFIKIDINRKASLRIYAICGFAILLFIVCIFKAGVCPAEQNQKDSASNPLDIISVIEESSVMSMPAEELPIIESKNNGYWWIQQSQQNKLSYIKDLINAFDLKDKGIKPGEITERLDIFYDPVDNPVDIKMDISLERAFYRMTKEFQTGDMQ